MNPTLTRLVCLGLALPALGCSTAANIGSADPSSSARENLPPVLDRVFVVEIDFFGQNEVSPVSVEVVDSAGPAHLTSGPDYLVEVVDLNGATLHEYTTWDPVLARGYDGTLHGETVLPYANAALIFPLSTRAELVTLTDLRLGQVVATVDLRVPIVDWCNQNPEEPACIEVFAVEG